MTRRINLPNNTSNFILQEMCERLQQGQTVRIAFGGRSMSPMINGQSDVVDLMPLAEGNPLKVGEIYLFLYIDHYVIHRLIRIDGDQYYFRGDACMSQECVRRESIIGQLKSVIHADGKIEDCASFSWRWRSKVVVAYRSLVNILKRLFSRDNRQWEVPVYFLALLILMWAPLNGLGVPLDNFVLGIRMDHLIHASVYIPCALFLMDLTGRNRWLMLLLAILVGICTESVQYLLPYRGFDINDMVANFFGATLGWLLVTKKMRAINK